MNSKLIAVVLCAALGAMGCGGSAEEEEASLKVTWTFTPTDGCQTDEEIHFSFSPDPFGEDDIFDCVNQGLSPPRQEGTMGGIPLGSYNIQASVWLGGSPEAGIAPFTFSKSFAVDGDALEHAVTFSRGFAAYDVAFTVDFGNVGGTDCEQTTSGGTGVNQQTVDLIDLADQTCVGVTIADTDATFDHEDACSATPSVCMGAGTGDILTLQGVPPGSYELVINGINFNSDICWEGTFAFDTADSTTAAFDLGNLNVLHNGASGGCSLKPERESSRTVAAK